MHSVSKKFGRYAAAGHVAIAVTHVTRALFVTVACDSAAATACAAACVYCVWHVAMLVNLQQVYFKNGQHH